jgi:hypothetical protein
MPGVKRWMIQNTGQQLPWEERFSGFPHNEAKFLCCMTDGNTPRADPRQGRPVSTCGCISAWKNLPTGAATEKKRLNQAREA